VSIRDYEGLKSGVTSKLPSNFSKATAAEIKHAAQFSPGGVTPAAVVTKPSKRKPFKPMPLNIALLLPHGGVAEFYFCEARQWRFDFAWPGPGPNGTPGVALEIDGGIYGRGKPCPTCGRKAVGAHTSIQRLKSDHEKLNEGAILGWVILRQTPEQLESGEAGALVARAIHGRKR
jgi:hypothetical protein